MAALSDQVLPLYFYHFTTFVLWVNNLNCVITLIQFQYAKDWQEPTRTLPVILLFLYTY